MSGPEEPRVVLADNAGLFTLGGTQTFLVGRERVAVLDPGPDLPAHREAILAELRRGRAGKVVIALTHHHPDHAAGVDPLARALSRAGIDTTVCGSELTDGDEVETDRGRLRVIGTPGHTRDHRAFHWPRANAAFPGDLVLGEGDTAWVGSYAGCVADYLESLRRMEGLGVGRLFPTHGPVIDDPAGMLARYRRHRLTRIEQVREAHAADPSSPAEALVTRIYGDRLPAGLRSGAIWSVRAMLDHLGVRPFPDEGPTGEGQDEGQAGRQRSGPPA